MGIRSVLIEHGIEADKSDIRVHVCPVAGRVYIFTASAAIDAIASGNCRETEAYTGTVKSSAGWLVKPDNIKDIKRLDLPAKWWKFIDILEDDDTSTKGRKAENLIRALILKHKFPEMGYPVAVEDVDMQHDGHDLLIPAKTIQVKCDYRGGEGGTGNLYIERAECNPLRKH